MTHAYSISGMTCGNCVGKVKSELLKVGDVLQADVQLSSPQATITMQKHILLPTLKNAISERGNYTISETSEHHAPVININTATADLKAYWPLILVFSFIIAIATITSFSQGEFHWLARMNNFMGGFFFAFSFFKFLDLKGFAGSYSTYDLLARNWKSYGLIYPFMELALGFAYITGFEPIVTNIATIIIMGFSSIGVIKAVLNKRKIQCACLGAVFNLPMSTVTIVEDLLMIVMAILALISIH